MPAQPAGHEPVMYGIPNCDTIKKARKWLQQHAVDYRFHDYKKLGIDEDQLKNWVETMGWEQLINKRGTSWRKLDETTRADMNDQTALRVMQENPSIIKRPLLQVRDQFIIGFDEAEYRKEFART